MSNLTSQKGSCQMFFNHFFSFLCLLHQSFSSLSHQNNIKRHKYIKIIFQFDTSVGAYMSQNGILPHQVSNLNLTILFGTSDEDALIDHL